MKGCTTDLSHFDVAVQRDTKQVDVTYLFCQKGHVWVTTNYKYGTYEHQQGGCARKRRARVGFSSAEGKGKGR